MTIVGFNFLKIQAENKKSIGKGKVTLNNNISVQSIDERKLPLPTDKQTVLSFTFQYVSKYEPSVADITLTGEVLYMTSLEEGEKIRADFKKSKKLPKNIVPEILNTALTKCNIQALLLSEQINVPPPIRLPKVEVQKAKK